MDEVVSGERAVEPFGPVPDFFGRRGSRAKERRNPELSYLHSRQESERLAPEYGPRGLPIYLGRLIDLVI